MRVVLITHPALFEPALCLMRELSGRVDLHVLLEVSARSWRTAGFDVGHIELRPGLTRADPVLSAFFPSAIRDCWRSVASFHLVSYPGLPGLHPASLAVSRAVLNFIRSVRADVVHADDVDISPKLALILAALRSVPLVISVHDPQPHTGERSWRKTLARRLAFPRAHDFVIFNRAGSHAFAAAYGLSAGAVHSTRLGTYDVLRAWSTDDGSRPSAPTVLFLGRLSPYKGLDVFYAAASRVAQRVPGVRFVVAGRPISGYVLPAAPALDRDGRIEVQEEYLSNAQVVRRLESATLVVCPYVDATQSGVVLSAFALRVPVVASAVGGLPEYVVPERTGLLVPPRDPEALAGAIVRVLRDPELARGLSAQIVAAEQSDLSWSRTADVICGAYDRAMSPS